VSGRNIIVAMATESMTLVGTIKRRQMEELVIGQLEHAGMLT
jgi:hypothetical protein